MEKEKKKISLIIKEKVYFYDDGTKRVDHKYINPETKHISTDVSVERVKNETKHREDRKLLTSTSTTTYKYDDGSEVSNEKQYRYTPKRQERRLTGEIVRRKIITFPKT